MSLKIRQALSLCVSSTVVLAQASVPTFANTIEEYKHEAFYGETVQEDPSIILEETVEEVIPYTAAMDPYVVYTQITKSNSDRSGNGTSQYPYNRFEDAVANVADGGTIIIKTGRSGFINAQDEYGQIPFIIDKDVTIRSESSSTKAVLNVRAGGIVLEGNVTFENIEFAFANKVHDGIFANGYTLKIIDCVQGSGSREIDLFAGSLYDTSGRLIEGMKYTGTNEGVLTLPEVGSRGEIIIKTTDKSIKSQFGKVFAGSMNGNYDGNANIEIVNNGELDLVGIYACGGHEAKPGNMFDVTEPLPPEERPDDYIVNGVVNISMKDYILDINGEGADEVYVELIGEYPVAYFKLNDVNGLTIHTGKFIPDELTWKNTFGDVTLSSQNAHLDLSKIKNSNNENKFTVNDFNGGGILTLQKEGHLTVNGDITGETVFQTVGGGANNSFSGMVIPEHTYITSLSKKGNTSSFKFTPSSLQKGCILELNDEGNWITSAIDVILPEKIKKFDFNKDEIILESDTNNFIGYSNAFEIESDLVDHILDWYYDLSFELSVTGYDVDYDAENEKWHFPEANLSFYIIEDFDHMLPALTVAPMTAGQPIIPGKYEVTLSLSDYGVSTTYELNVVSDASTSHRHHLDIEITNDSSYTHHISFGDDITIGTNINKSSTLIENFALENEYDFYVNDQLVYSGPKDRYTLNVSTDLFKVGENVVKVLYGGSDTVERLIDSTVIQVEKGEHQISLLPKLDVTYDGRPHSLVASIPTLSEVEPIVYYYTDEDHTDGETTTPPVNVGVYYVKAILPENEYYTATEAKGTITIQKATPQLSLSGIPKENNDLEISVSMLYPEAGQIPNGKVQLNLIDGENRSQTATVQLKNGLLAHTFNNVASGKVTVTATYIPEINENGMTYIDSYYNGVTGISDTFEMVKDYIPVQNIEFVAPELQFYVEQNGIYYQNISNMQLPVIITPNNASNQSITWTSSNPNIITIDKDGQVVVCQPGQAIITAIAKGGKVMHTCEVTVVEMTADTISVKDITFDKSSMNLDLTTHLTDIINVTLESSQDNMEPTCTDIAWKSMDTSIIDVKTSGDSKIATVEAKGEGTTTVVAVTKDGAKVATCTVTVTQEQIGSGGDSDSSTPDVDNPDLDVPDINEPEIDQPEVDKPETDIPGEDYPENNTPDKDEPEIGEMPDNSGGSGSGSNGGSSGSSGSGSGSSSNGGSNSGSSNGKPETDVTDENTNSDAIQQPSKPTTTISKFADISDNHWAKDDIQYLVGKGLFKGVSETTFGVSVPTTRGMFVTVLHRLAGTPQLGTVSFIDVKSGLYYTDAISWAHTLGIVSGVNQTHFMPNQNITREQLVLILYKYARRSNPEIENSKVNLSGFKDIEDISNWSKDAMEWAVSVGILKGDASNRLQPKANATRAEVCAIMRRFINLSQK